MEEVLDENQEEEEEVEAGDEDLEDVEDAMEGKREAPTGADGGLEEVQDGDRPQKRSKARPSGTLVTNELQEVSQGARGSATVVPSKTKQLRACLVCGLVKSTEQFFEQGCDNCESFVHFRDDRDRIMVATSSRFTGLIAMVDSTKSWVARYQRFKPNFVPGCYAVSVLGQLPQEVRETLDDAGYNYIPRDFLERALVTQTKK